MKYIPEETLRSLCARIDGDYGLYLSIPQTGEKLVLHPDTRFVSASTIKIPLLALLLRDGEEGRLDLETPVPIPPVNQVAGAGILQSLADSVSLSLFDYSVLMMAISDNVATNQVIDAVGMERANAFFAEYGWNTTHLGRKMMTPGALLSDGTREQNYTSAADLADMMERILAGTMVNQSVSTAMMQIMAGQRNGKFRPALPDATHYNPHKALTLPADGKVLLVAKSGTLSNPMVAHDAAILILPNGRTAVLVMTTATRDNAKTEKIMGQVARTVYEALK